MAAYQTHYLKTRFDSYGRKEYNSPPPRGVFWLKRTVKIFDFNYIILYNKNIINIEV